MTATVPYVLQWLGIAVACLAAPLLLVLPITPLLDRRTDWRRRRASRLAGPVLEEGPIQLYMWTQTLDRRIRLALAA